MLSKLPELWEKEIINIEKPVDWVQETSDQLIKDFTMLDIPLEFKPLANQPYIELFNQAKEKIGELFEKDYHGFLNLLYRVDLSEEDLHRVVTHSVPPQLYEDITELLLKREFMKVVLRHRYS